MNEYFPNLSLQVWLSFLTFLALVPIAITLVMHYYDLDFERTIRVTKTKLSLTIESSNFGRNCLYVINIITCQGELIR